MILAYIFLGLAISSATVGSMGTLANDNDTSANYTRLAIALALIALVCWMMGT